MIIEAMERGRLSWIASTVPATMKEVIHRCQQQSAVILQRWRGLPAGRWNGMLDFARTRRPAAPMAWSFFFDIIHHRGQITT
jgi:hypothetical protein